MVEEPGRPDGAGASEWPQRDTGKHNRVGGSGRESDRLIVARKRVTTVERRGRSHCERMSEEG